MKDLIALNIKYLREKENLSQTELASLVGGNRGNIDSYERGIAKPKTDIANNICKHFGISLDALYNQNLSQPEQLQKIDTDVSLGIKITPRGPKHTREEKKEDTPDERDVFFEKMRQLTYNKYKDMISDGKPQYEMFGDLDLRLYLVEKAILRRPE